MRPAHALAVAALVLGVAPSVVEANTVSAVQGSAFGYSANVSLFGGPNNARGPAPTVTLPAAGSNAPITATAPSATATVGPATFFSSGQLTVSTQGTLGPSGSVTTSASVLNINTSGNEQFTAARADSTCGAASSGTSASTSITGGTLQTDSGDDANGDGDYVDAGEHPPVTVAVPANPAPNTLFNGHLHVNGSVDNWRYVFNEQTVNANGSITTYAAHQTLLGPTAVGDVYIGKVVCGVTSSPTPDSVSSPTITGTPTQGQVLTEQRGGWTNSPTSYAVQWLRCDTAGGACSAVAGATAQTYALTAGDVGHAMRVQEIASNADGASAPAASAPTAVVAALAGEQTTTPTTSTTSTTPAGTAPVTAGDVPAPLPTTAAAAPPVGTTTATCIPAPLLSQVLPKRQPRIGAVLRARGVQRRFTSPCAGIATIEWFQVPNGARLAGVKPLRVAVGTTTFSTAGTKTVQVRLTRAGRRLLRRVRRVTLTVRGSYKSAGRPTIVVKRTFSLRR